MHVHSDYDHKNSWEVEKYQQRHKPLCGPRHLLIFLYHTLPRQPSSRTSPPQSVLALERGFAITLVHPLPLSSPCWTPACLSTTATFNQNLPVRLCYRSKVAHSIICSLIQSNLPFCASVPTDCASNMSWWRGRGECASVCMRVCLCVYERAVTLWMTSFRGAINRACPWAVGLSYEFSLEKQQTEQIEQQAFEATHRKGYVTECVMCVCIQFKSQIW